MAKIEIRTKDVVTLPNVPASQNPQHSYILYTNNAGKQMVLRAGPEHGNALIDDIKVVNQPYKDSKDWPRENEHPHHSVVIAQGTDAEMQALFDKMWAQGQAINAKHYDYGALDQNCNTATAYMMHAAGLPAIYPKDENGQAVFTPGATNDFSPTFKQDAAELMDKLTHIYGENAANLFEHFTHIDVVPSQTPIRVGPVSWEQENPELSNYFASLAMSSALPDQPKEVTSEPSYAQVNAASVNKYSHTEVDNLDAYFATLSVSPANPENQKSDVKELSDYFATLSVNPSQDVSQNKPENPPEKSIWKQLAGLVVSEAAADDKVVLGSSTANPKDIESLFSDLPNASPFISGGLSHHAPNQHPKKHGAKEEQSVMSKAANEAAKVFQEQIENNFYGEEKIEWVSAHYPKDYDELRAEEETKREDMVEFARSIKGLVIAEQKGAAVQVQQEVRWELASNTIQVDRDGSGGPKDSDTTLRGALWQQNALAFYTQAFAADDRSLHTCIRR